MDTHKLATQIQPLVLSELELLWRALMTKFEDASQEVLASLYAHETQKSQEALDALIRAELRRSMVLKDMLEFLDSMDDSGDRSQ